MRTIAQDGIYTSTISNSIGINDMVREPRPAAVSIEVVSMRVIWPAALSNRPKAVSEN